MKNLTKSLVTIIMVLICFNSHAQIGVTSYSVYSLGINTSQERTISGEFKTFANTAFEDLSMEAAVFYNFKPKTYHRFSVGAGLNFDPFRDFDPLSAFTIPIQLEMYPLQNFKKLSLLFELTPEIGVERDSNLRSLWGIRYTFGDLKE